MKQPGMPWNWHLESLFGEVGPTRLHKGLTLQMRRVRSRKWSLKTYFYDKKREQCLPKTLMWLNLGSLTTRLLALCVKLFIHTSRKPNQSLSNESHPAKTAPAVTSVELMVVEWLGLWFERSHISSTVVTKEHLRKAKNIGMFTPFTATIPNITVMKVVRPVISANFFWCSCSAVGTTIPHIFSNYTSNFGFLAFIVKSSVAVTRLIKLWNQSSARGELNWGNSL